MNINNFKRNIKTWDDLRLSDAYQTYCKRLEDPKYSLKKGLLEDIINSIREEWVERKNNEGAEYSSPRNGLLSTMGYKVGMEGYKEKVRRRILQDVISGPLPLVGNPEYMEEWGGDGSNKRIKKLKNCLKGFSSGKLHETHHLAIKDWQEDLEWLYKYIGK
ncbi:hypothetical protein N9450_04575 [Gammaproteobacteria bacterium]|nr:hypothetical protein [Gammaproteobacteria bacterium]